MALRNLYNQFIETFNKLTKLQKVSILASTIAVFAAVITLIVWANRPVFKTLYADMAENDIKQVTAALDGKNIPYRVTGSTVEVQGEQVHQARIDLALIGLPEDRGVGFELFDQSKLGMTEFMQNVNYVRALQGELARSITSFNEIATAKVHLSIPKERIFVTDDEEAKASVVVQLMPGRTLAPEQVRAIAHLVAAAVKGLTPNAVQILDTNGNLLSDFLNEEQSPVVVTRTQLEHQQQIEKDLEKKLQGILSKTLGVDRYVARVSVEMDFNTQAIMREEFADTPVLRSQHSLEINSRNNGQGPAGIPGVESNLAEPDLLVDNIMSEYSKTEETQNFEISRTVTNEQRNHGIIKRLTASVVVDDKRELVDEGGTKVSTQRPRTDEEMAKIRSAVGSAIGYNPSRGDVVDITNISFDTTGELVDLAYSNKEKMMEWIGVVAKYSSAVLILIVFYFLVIRPILKRLDNARELDEDMMGESALDAQLASLDITVGGESGFPKTVEELEREIESELNESVPVDVEAVKSKVMLKKIEEAANEDPEMVANLVKALIKGG